MTTYTYLLIAAFALLIIGLACRIGIEMGKDLQRLMGRQDHQPDEHETTYQERRN